MKRITVGKFKDQCLTILDGVDRDGVVITKHGKPVARLLPIALESAELIGAMAGRIKFKGDLLSTGVPWRAQS